jgi:peptidoglycan/LPS O-acetylase OafA/YrhL
LARSTSALVPYLLLAGNWATIVFGPPKSAALPLWSVSVEEQFYLTWPLLVARLTPNGIVKVAFAMIGLGVVSRAVVVLLHGGAWTIWAGTFCRLDPMAVGVLLAVYLRGQAPALRKSQRFSLIVGGTLCSSVAGWIVFAAGDAHPWISMFWVYPLAAAAAGAIVFGSIGIRFRLPVLEYLGKISYGLYVFHQTCIWIADRVLGDATGVSHAVLREALAFTLTVLVAIASYTMIEKPFLELKDRFAHVRSRPV